VAFLRASIVFFGFALFAPALRAALPLLPFTLDDPDNRWRLVTSERTLDGGLKLAAVMGPRHGPAQMLVFNATADDESPLPPPDFAARLRSAVISAPVSELRHSTTTRIGYTGHLEQFATSVADATYRCELFAFAVGRERWALLQIQPATGGPARVSLFTLLKPAAPVPAGALAVAPFKVKEDPLTSFPISLHVRRDPANERLSHIYVTDVPSDSSTERVGVKVGDEILRIDGRAVTDFRTGVDRGSELGRILVNRPPGSVVDLEIITPGDPSSRRVRIESPRLGLNLTNR